MNITTTHDDICINRHRDSDVSIEANRRAKLSKSEVRAQVYSIARSLGSFTSKDIGALIAKPINKFSGRLTELCAAGLIVKTAYRRDGCAVYRVARPDGQILLF